MEWLLRNLLLTFAVLFAVIGTLALANVIVEGISSAILSLP